jgi:hypothetical protein
MKDELNWDADLGRQTVADILYVLGGRLLKQSEAIARLAAKSPVERRICAEHGYVFSDEDLEFVRRRDARRELGQWSVADEFSSGLPPADRVE